MQDRGIRDPFWDEAQPKRRRRGHPLRRLDQPSRVLIRDFAIFELKQLLDGAKGFVIAQAAIAALVADLLTRRIGRPTRLFYEVLRIGERADDWLDLYGAGVDPEKSPEGLFGVSEAGAPTLLGQLEKLADRWIVGERAEAPAAGEAAVEAASAGAAAGTATPAGAAEEALRAELDDEAAAAAEVERWHAAFAAGARASSASPEAAESHAASGEPAVEETEFPEPAADWDAVDPAAESA